MRWLATMLPVARRVDILGGVVPALQLAPNRGGRVCNRSKDLQGASIQLVGATCNKEKGRNHQGGENP